MLGKKHGRGTFIWADGSHYIGDFVNNCMDGFGEYVKSNGKKVYNSHDIYN